VTTQLVRRQQGVPSQEARLGRDADALRLDAEATRLAERFEAAFWCPEIETYALALDGAKNPCRVHTSNAGQVLSSGIAGSDRAACVAAGLVVPRFFSGWGIRTLARGPRYNPMSYHNGSVWPHDNALIALGLARYPTALRRRVCCATAEINTLSLMRMSSRKFCWHLAPDHKNNNDQISRKIKTLLQGTGRSSDQF
jgi:glycogen debranching enzyme